MYISSEYEVNDILRKYKTLNKGTLYRILSNRMYLGKIVYSGIEADGKHPPIISKEIFDKAQTLRTPSTAGTRTKSYKYQYLLTGLIRCHCGRFMSPASAKSGRYHYYACSDMMNCKHRIKAEGIEDAALAKIRTLKLDKRLIDAALAEITQRRLEQAKDMRPELKNLNASLIELKKKQDALVDMIMTGSIDHNNLPILNQKLSTLRVNIETIQARIDKINNDCMIDLKVFDIAGDVIRALDNFQHAIEASNCDRDVMRQALLLNIAKIQELEDGTFRFYFNFSKKSSSIGLGWGGRFRSCPLPS